MSESQSGGLLVYMLRIAYALSMKALGCPVQKIAINIHVESSLSLNIRSLLKFPA